MSEQYGGPQWVGIDLHRRRSVIVRMTDEGETLETIRIVNDPERLRTVLARAGEAPEVVMEATYGWYWAADTITATGAQLHLAHPLGVKAFSYRRVKTDERDAADLADLLRMGRLPEAWVAPPEVRELRELIRHRAKLVAIRTHLKCQVHAVLANCGIQVLLTDLFGVSGTELLDSLELPSVYAARVTSLRRLITDVEFEIELFAKRANLRLAGDPGFKAVRTIPGVGSILGAVFVAEIGDVHRFPGPDKLCCWAGLTPKHHESDRTVHRGRITKQGSRLVRWAAVESVKILPKDSHIGQVRERVAERRGRNIGTVAAAREQLQLVYYALRDGEVRCLAPRAGAA